MLSLHTPEAEYPVPPEVGVTRLAKRRRTDVLRLARATGRFARDRDVVAAFQTYPGVLCLLGRVSVPWVLVNGDVPGFHWKDASVRGGVPEWLIRRAFRRAGAVSVPGRALAGSYEELGIRARRWATIPNLVDDEAFAEGEARRAGALFAGRLYAEKGPLLAVEAAAAAGVPLTMHGTGPLQAEVERRARELGADVTLAGFTSNLREAFGRHRALIVSSQIESFGNVIVEALAVRTPVVAADIDFGPREILRDARFSRVVPRTVEALAAALRETVERPREPAEAQECLEIARRYAPGAVLPGIEELLATVAGSNSSASRRSS